MLKILLTRSYNNNKQIIEKYKNFYYIEYPMLSYEDNIGYLIELLKKHDSFIITSNHLASIIAKLLTDLNKDATFWVVGKASAEVIKNAGGGIKFQADNVKQLIKEIIEQNVKAIYLSGDNITTNFPQTIVRFIVYHTFYKKNFAIEEVNSIKQGIDYILLFSIETAKVLLKLYKQNNLLPYLEETVIITISYEVAKIVRLYCKNVLYCKYGTQDNMMVVLEDDAKSKNRNGKEN